MVRFKEALVVAICLSAYASLASGQVRAGNDDAGDDPIRSAIQKAEQLRHAGEFPEAYRVLRSVRNGQTGRRGAALMSRLCPQKIWIVAKLPPSPGDNRDVNHRGMASRRSDDQRAVCVYGLRPECLPGSAPERQVPRKSGDERDCNRRRIRELSNEDAARSSG